MITPEDTPHPASSDSGVAPAGQPSGEAVFEEEQKRKCFTSLPMRSANRLMELLFKDDSFYEMARFAWVRPEDAKRLFLYGVSKEVLKVVIGMLDDEDHFRDAPALTKPDRLEKVILGAYSDEQAQRVRKLVELLSLLILFDRRCKRDEEYRVYLNAENLNLALSRLEDFKELYTGAIIGNTKHSVDDFARRIQEDFATMGVTGVWFLDPGNLKRLHPSVFVGRKRQLLDALLVASPDERLALGISYGRGYSAHSQSVHPLLGSHDYAQDENALDQLKGQHAQTGIIAMHVTRMAYKLAGEDDPNGIDKIMGPQFEKSNAGRSMQRMAKTVEVGDLILTAWTNLAEVLEVNAGKYGYKAVRIRYVSRPPLAETPEDWIESEHVMIRLMTRVQMRRILEKEMANETAPKEVRELLPELLKQPDDRLMESARMLFLKLHEAGALIPMLVKEGYLKQPEAPGLRPKDESQSAPSQKDQPDRN